MSLNFTHRSAFGSYGKGDVHGDFEALAKETVEYLGKTYPSVFEPPTYPVDRGELNDLFQHKIDLVDPHAPPPKRKLYPLDDLELQELRK